MIAGTRAALGAGIGLLPADAFAPDTRRAVGWTLLAVGALTTVPFLAHLILRHDPADVAANQAKARLSPIYHT